MRICAMKHSAADNNCGLPSLIPRQLRASPMLVLARRIEHPLDMAIQRPHDADAREHRRAAERRDEDQGFHCCLPFGGLVLGFRELRDIGSRLLEGDELATARQGDRIVKTPLPSFVRLQ
jgi:hypothetical protein